MTIDIKIDKTQLQLVESSDAYNDEQTEQDESNEEQAKCFEYNYSVQLKPNCKKIIEKQVSETTWDDFDEALVADIPTYWVTDDNQLEVLMDKLESCTQVAFDTEFIKRNTYYPKLALVQVNTGEAIYLIDAPKLDLYDFWAVIADIPVIIWHACGEDLGIFYLLSDLPSLDNVFDTQIAIGFLTGKLQVGYQKSLEQMLSVNVDKEQSQSDWLARPLSHEQEVYAVNDVKYLLPMYQIMVKKLSQLNLLEQVWEDCQLYANDLYKLYDTKDEDQYLTALDPKFNGLQREFLRELLTWRERLARATNQPRTFIIKKQAIRELVDILPISVKQLKYDTTVHRTVIETYGKEIINLVAKAKKAKATDYPAAKLAPYRSKTKTIQKTVNKLTSSLSAETGIPVAVIMKKKWLADIYELIALDVSDKLIDTAYIDELTDLDNSPIPKALQGWRYKWLKTELIPGLVKFKQELRYGMNIDNRDGAED